MCRGREKISYRCFISFVDVFPLALALVIDVQPFEDNRFSVNCVTHPN